MPRQLLSGTMHARRPAHGPRRRWKDCAVSDLKSRGVYGSWYATAPESRVEWRAVYTSTFLHSVLRSAAAAVNCAVCKRTSSRTQDRARHKCTAERAKPVNEQRGVCPCDRCGHWFLSRGGLARHKCVAQSPASVEPWCGAHCASCDRCFRSVQGRNRHHCSGSPRPYVSLVVTVVDDLNPGDLSLFVSQTPLLFSLRCSSRGCCVRLTLCVSNSHSQTTQGVLGQTTNFFKKFKRII